MHQRIEIWTTEVGKVIDETDEKRQSESQRIVSLSVAPLESASHMNDDSRVLATAVFE